jgi:hypothetical protein
MKYTKPAVRDYGTLVEITQFMGLFGTEDGASKAIPNHHEPSSGPAGP